MFKDIVIDYLITNKSLFGYVYIISTDFNNIYKIGRTNNIFKRIKSLQTNCVTNLKILNYYETIDCISLEFIIHKILEKYRINKREHFCVNLNIINMVIYLSNRYINLKFDKYTIINMLKLLLNNLFNNNILTI